MCVVFSRVLFFFSSRRRHTRSKRDWSSDVCSSDLKVKWLESVLQVAILYLVYEIGVWIQSTLDLFIPGSVIGLILLFMLLMTKMYPLKCIENGSKFMNKHLVLFFITATVGIMNHYRLIAGKGIFLIGIVIASTVCVMGASGFVSQQLAKKGEKRHG